MAHDVYEGHVDANYQPHGYGVLRLANGDVYQGEFEHGNRSKWGKLIKKQDESVTHHCYYSDGTRYEGQMTDNKPWGKGTKFLENKTIYSGEWKDGFRSGQGIQYFPDGDKYEGEFLKDLPMGCGTMVYSNGESFSGNWKGMERSGKGTLFPSEGHLKSVYGEWAGSQLVLSTAAILEWRTGERYEGEVNQAFQRHGKGVFITLSGQRYDGGWENDEKRGWGRQMHGDGTITDHCYFPTGGKYEGGMLNLDPHGRGVRYFPDWTVEYTGEWKQGLRHGRGTNRYANGDSYEGNWVTGCRSGNGTQCYKNGDRYEGNWNDDVRSGRGCFFPSSGEIKSIEGEWEDAKLKLEAQTNVIWTSGDSFVGIVNAKYQPNGKGVQQLANGDRYSGEWIDGERRSWGSYIRTGQSTTTYHCYWSNGGRYEGEMKDWLPHGHGVQYLANGNVEYEGKWESNQRCGYGLSYHSDGSRYDGYWKDNKKHGEGTHFCANGDKYVGAWKEDERCGTGQFFPAGGDIQSVKGEWKNGALVLEAPAALLWRTGDNYTGCVNNSYQPDGLGTHRFASGDVYKGEFKNGARKSWGELIRANGRSTHHCYWGNGERYEGDMQDKLPHGTGIKYYSKYFMNGHVEYEGQWKEGKHHGRGTKYYSNHERYDGEWAEDKRSGEGNQWVNKERYTGSWLDDERCGVGTLYLAETDDSGMKSVWGQWKHNALCLDKIAIVVWQNDERYEGFVNSSYQPHGRGFQVTPGNGYRTDGEWQNGNKVSWSRNIRPEDGQFFCQFYQGEKYKGEIKDGLLWGKGTKYYVGGDVYTGEWETDMKSGHGTYTHANGDRYEGQWVKDKREGEGTKFYTNGDRYTGQWVNDEQCGEGIFFKAQGQLLSIRGRWAGTRVLIQHSVELTWRSGERYEGTLNTNYQPHGRGTQKLTNGDRYEGEWREGERRFWGCYIRANGDTMDHYFWLGGARYEGSKLNDEFSGPGKKYYSNGNVEYEGEWAKNMRHGKGTHHAPNGERYDGQWERDVRCGQGAVTYTNGDRYEGMWAGNDRQGPGTFYWKYGDRLSVSGEWDNINLVKGSQATLVWRSGDSYTGEVNAAYKPHGKGVLQTDTGEQYIGEWEDGVRRRWGRFVKGGETVHHYYWPNGDRYEGNMSNYQRSGTGKQLYFDGSRYEGQWKKDQRCGQGLMIYANGDKYQGEWLDDARSGHGEATWQDDAITLTWTGIWEHDQKAGIGELVLANGVRKQCIFVQDRRKSSFKIGQLVIVRTGSRAPARARVMKIMVDFRCKVRLVQEDGQASLPFAVNESEMEAIPDEADSAGVG